MKGRVYRVSGLSYNKKEYMREWCKRARSDDGSSLLAADIRPKQRYKLNQHDAPWFVEATHAAGKLDKVFGDSVQEAIDRTEVFVALSNYGDMQKDYINPKPCIWFQDKRNALNVVPVSKDPSKNSIRQNIQQEARLAVDDQIYTFRSQNSSTRTCIICNESINPGENTHVDHGVGEHAFQSILDAFLQTIAMGCPYTEHTYKALAGHKREQWQAFHKKRAQLAIVHASCNLKQPKKRKLHNL